MNSTARATLRDLYSAHHRIRQAEYERNSLVRAARRQGASWSEIARQLGVTPQAAWKRFGRASA